MDVRIRAASLGDVRHLVRLDGVVHALHRQWRPDLFAAAEPNLVAEHFSSAIGSGDLVLVAAGDATLLGFVHAQAVVRPAGPALAERSVVLVHELVVADDARRRGVGRALMAAVEEYAARQGAADVRLQHYAMNRSAHDFYRALGYETELLTMAKQCGPR